MSKHTYDSGLIGNCAYIAHIEKDTNISWLCMPRFDSDFIFGGMLDRKKGGKFTVLPESGDYTSTQTYVENTNILETIVRNGSDSYKVTDFAPRFKNYDRYYKPLMLIRKVEPISGSPKIRIECQPVTERGQIQLTPSQGSNHIRYMGIDQELRLTTNAPLTYVCEKKSFALQRPVYLVLTYGRPLEAPIESTSERFLQSTREYWQAWVKSTSIPNFHQRLVLRSALILKIHQFEDTGAIIAASTTSLPESPGSTRNWDYRYCWMRDAYFVLSAFVRCGLQDEAEAYFNWLMHATQRDKPELRPVYDIFGRSDLPEKEVSHLEGYRNSAPVRIGNGASQQVQLDSYGSVILGARALVEQGGTFGRSEAKRLAGFVETVCGNWQQPDNGIWEMRRGRLHHLYSKAMCWGALDGALWLEERDLLELDRDKVRSNLDTIRAVVLEHGWNEDRQAYTGALDCEHLDASVLLLPKLGIIEADHPRMVATYERIDAELAKGSFVWRYDPSIDDNSSPEGAFMACSFWAAEYLALAGRRDEAAGRMRKLLGAGNDLRIFSEEYDPEAQIMLGNLPQGLSHAALVHAALALGEKNGDEV